MISLAVLAWQMVNRQKTAGNSNQGIIPSQDGYSTRPDIGESLFGSSLDRGTLSGKRLFDTGRPLRVWRAQAIQQPVRAGFEKLRNPREGRDGEWKAAVFYRADGLHMDTRQFRQTLLSQAGFEAGLTDVSAQYTKDFAIVHSLLVSNGVSAIDTG
jgi:hypothetical protein